MPGIEHIPKEIKKFICDKTIKVNFYRIQPYDSKCLAKISGLY